MAKKIKKKILIVEDDEDFISILEAKFTSEGFSVCKAKDGEEGVFVTENEKPGLIVTDILMPKMNGMEMAKKIRETNKKISILFLTNIREEDYVKEMKELGNCEYLNKSELRINDIVERVKNKFGL